VWCAAGTADANMSEVLFWSLMLCVTNVGTVKKLETVGESSHFRGSSSGGTQECMGAIK
jgi:hypothetical protein